MSYGILEQFQQDIEQLRDINRTLVNGTQVLHDYIATLKAELDAARQDTERLEVMERHGWHALSCSIADVQAYWSVGFKSKWFSAPTLREAIDTAMAMLDAEEGA
jgi:hypothetical protein